MRALACLALVLAACSGRDDGDRADSGDVDIDAGPADVDAGPGDVDAGPGDVDAGPADVDAGPRPMDAGPAPRDAGPGMRVPSPDRCARGFGTCSNDSDCVGGGGCGGEMCYPARSEPPLTTCDCTAPSGAACGCIDGMCDWYVTGGGGAM